MKRHAKDPRPRPATSTTMAPEEIEVSELSPLLGRQIRPSTTRILGRRKRPWTAASLADFASGAGKALQIRDPAVILWTCCAIILLFQGAQGFLDIPLIKVLEGIVCRQFYHVDDPGQPVDEALCRADGVQAKLAFLFAVNSSLDAGLSGLLALAWGIAADKCVLLLLDPPRRATVVVVISKSRRHAALRGPRLTARITGWAASRSLCWPSSARRPTWRGF